MVNGVLVERIVSDVLPALQTNADGLKKVLEDLLKQYQTKQAEMEKWKVGLMCNPIFAYCDADTFDTQKKNNIQIVQQ
jgi:prefoldin subunit 2